MKGPTPVHWTGATGFLARNRSDLDAAKIAIVPIGLRKICQKDCKIGEAARLIFCQTLSMTRSSRITEQGVRAKRFGSPASDVLLLARHVTGLVTRLGVAWDAAVNAIAPIGYEDEWGFHYGVRPKANSSDGHAAN